MINSEGFSRISSFNGIDVYCLNSEKFKTNIINIFFHDQISDKTATNNALFPAILRRGTQKLPSFEDIYVYLEELYGASFDCGVSKKGEQHIIEFYIEYIKERFTSDNDNLFEKCFDFLIDIIFNPQIQNDMFKNDYFMQEKENLKMLIESRVNDKITYALERCFEEMCKGEPFSIYDYGSLENLEKIQNKELFAHYQNVLKTLPISIFITGDVKEDKIQKIIKRLEKLERSNIKTIQEPMIVKKLTEIKEIEEKMNVTQAKLSLGFRTNISSKNEDYYSLLVYNGILGGGSHSKLFMNVREKESLAYYTYSRLEKYMGLMIIASGIEIKNKQKAMSIIKEQMDDIKNGIISDYEFDATIKSLETGLMSLKDSQYKMIDFYLSQLVSKTDDKLENIIKKVKKVNKEDILRVAQKIQLDTIYFLTSN